MSDPANSTHSSSRAAKLPAPGTSMTPAAQATEIAEALEQLMRLQFARSFTHGLKPAQWQALRFFATAAESQRTVSAFSRHRRSTMGTASTTISTLVRKGYLGRRAGSTRNSGLFVTAAGHLLLLNDPFDALVRAAATLDAGARAVLRENLPTLLERMGAHQAVPDGAQGDEGDAPNGEEIA